jgi:hypothetical protein
LGPAFQASYYRAWWEQEQERCNGEDSSGVPVAQATAAVAPPPSATVVPQCPPEAQSPRPVAAFLPPPQAGPAPTAAAASQPEATAVLPAATTGPSITARQAAYVSATLAAYRASGRCPSVAVPGPAPRRDWEADWMENLEEQEDIVDMAVQRLRINLKRGAGLEELSANFIHIGTQIANLGYLWRAKPEYIEAQHGPALPVGVLELLATQIPLFPPAAPVASAEAEDGKPATPHCGTVREQDEDTAPARAVVLHPRVSSSPPPPASHAESEAPHGREAVAPPRTGRESRSRSRWKEWQASLAHKRTDSGRISAVSPRDTGRPLPPPEGRTGSRKQTVVCPPMRRDSRGAPAVGVGAAPAGPACQQPAGAGGLRSGHGRNGAQT